MRLHGKCHCGNIGVELEWPGEPPEIPARACDCSFCTKHGGVWTSNPAAALEIRIEDPELVSKYEFGTRTATFHVCTRCGNVPVVTCELDGKLHAVVNVNALENIEPSWLRRATSSFGGEDIETRLARRKRNWIANARFVGKPGKS
jgi:hypothetical protein